MEQGFVAVKRVVYWQWRLHSLIVAVRRGGLSGIEPDYTIGLEVTTCLYGGIGTKVTY